MGSMEWKGSQRVCMCLREWMGSQRVCWGGWGHSECDGVDGLMGIN